MNNIIESFPRRQRLDKCTPAELSIYKAMEEVEKIGADVKLTNAIIKLDEARNLVADFVDSEPREHKYYYCKECGFTFLLADNASVKDIEIFNSLAIFHKNPKLEIPCRQELVEISEKEFLIIRNGE